MYLVSCPESTPTGGEHQTGGLSYISCHGGMSSIGAKINAPFCTVCHVALPSSTQRSPLTLETLAVNEMVVDFFVVPVLRKPF